MDGEGIESDQAGTDTPNLIGQPILSLASRLSNAPGKPR